MLKKIDLKRETIDEQFVQYVNKKFPLVKIEWEKVVNSLKKNGEWQQLMRKDNSLSRMQSFLRTLESGIQEIRTNNLYQPYPLFLPCFPGIKNMPVHEIAHFSFPNLLLENFSIIKKEIMDLKDEDYSNYDFDGDNRILAFPFYFKGEEIPQSKIKCPKIYDLLQQVPRLCSNYPMGDFVVSRMAPGTHLHNHCSADNLRIRTMLGINTVENSFLRVCDNEYFWEEGKIFIWEDSFEHESANYGNQDRIILVFDTWHTDLTDIEIDILTKLPLPPPR